MVPLCSLKVSNMNERIKQLAEQAAGTKKYVPPVWQFFDDELETLVKLVAKECVTIIESQRVSVGNSPAGELACEWTMDALRDCRDEIKDHFGL